MSVPGSGGRGAVDSRNLKTGYCCRCASRRVRSSVHRYLCPYCLAFLQEGGGRGRAPGSPLSPTGAQFGLWDAEADLRREGSAVHGCGVISAATGGVRGSNESGCYGLSRSPWPPSTDRLQPGLWRVLIGADGCSLFFLVMMAK